MLKSTCQNKKYAEEVIEECATAWKNLVSGNVPDSKGISLVNTTLKNSTAFVTDAGIPEASPKPAAPIDKSVDKWFFISGSA
ncbi:unnamed protein product [Ambrosiozyma monospora]|uniref:Unnamed protein product n=1 Tax=Ambrosiozyma monospora TaxID=43982 RepID=A0ACB5SWL6_AMBMO|nr:unnamed protein product [Ambrosiozyma monospora]